MGKGGFLGQLAMLYVSHEVQSHHAQQRAGGGSQQAAVPSEEREEMTDEEFEEFRGKSTKFCGTVAAMCVVYAVYTVLATPAVAGQSVTYVMASHGSADCSGAATSDEVTKTATELCALLSAPPPPPDDDDGWTCREYPDGEPAELANGECVYSEHCTKYGYDSIDVSMKMLLVFATTKDDFYSAACSLCADDITAADEADGVEYECSFWERSGRSMCLWIGGISGLCL